MAISPDLIPKWTKRVITESGGRDPLGLSRVSQVITDFLLTGIITTTDRARYYSFYCWALWHIDRVEKIEQAQDFIDGFRRREAALALATRLNNPSTSPVGVVAVDSTISASSSGKTLDCNFRVLPSNALGGYGQYYAGSLYLLGLTHRPTIGIDKITEGIAENLAVCYHDSIKKTPYITKQLYTKNEIAFDELKNSARYMTLDALSEPFASSERDGLMKMFFALNDGKQKPRDIFRKNSLAQILFLISEYEKRGRSARFDKLDQDIVYPAYYYNQLAITESNIIPYHVPKIFRETHSIWKQFCLQQFFTQALECLMFAVLETVGSETVGLTLDVMLSRLTGKDFLELLSNLTGKDCLKPCDLLLALSLEKIPDETTSLYLQQELSLSHKLSEANILMLDKKAPQKAFVYGIIILSVLYGKWRGIMNDVGFSYVGQAAGMELWSRSLFSHIDQWFDARIDWEQALYDIIETFILNQHDRIMYEKRRLDSCWLRRIDGRIIKDQDYDPRWRSSRHRNAVTILRDLNLLKIDNTNQVFMTSEGRNLMKVLMGD